MGCLKLSYEYEREGLELSAVFLGEGLEKSATEQNFRTNYYPFGLHHSSSWTRVNDLKNNFLFNAGSELNEQTKNYETPFRQYDPALGRFTGIDALASSFSSWTPYQFAYNDPIAFNDPTGLQNQSGLMGDMYGNGREELGQSQYGVRQADYGSFGHGAYWNAAFMSFSQWNSTYGIDQMSQQEKANFARSQGRYDGDFIADALGALGNNIGVDANGNLIHYQEHSTSLYSNAGTVWGAQYVIPQVLNVSRQLSLESNTVRHAYDYGTSISLAGNLTLFGGFSFELGFAWDNDGDRTWYFQLGPSLGIDVSLGGLAKNYVARNQKDGFDVTDLQGYGASYSGSILGGDATWGGSFLPHPDYDDWFNPFTDMGETYYEIGAGFSAGIPVGATYEYTYTWTFATVPGVK